MKYNLTFSQEETTYRVYFWNNESVGYSPAIREVSVDWVGDILSAVLHVKVEPCGWWGEKCHLRKVIFNEVTIWEGDTTEDVVLNIEQLIQKGINKLRLDYDTSYVVCVVTPWSGCTHATAYMEISVSGGSVVTKPPPTIPGGWNMVSWIVIGVLAIGGLGVVAYFLSQLPKKK